MQRYKITKKIGEGAFSNVFLAIHVDSGQPFAIKVHKPGLIDSSPTDDLREVAILKKIKHEAIIRLETIFMWESQLYMVFEYMQQNLFEKYLCRAQPVSDTIIKNVVFKIAGALETIHSAGYFHRDLKPENILISHNQVKLADFGLARKCSGIHPFTDYVSTRWYRAPQLVVRMDRYTAAVDIFALGCIMAEMFNGVPLFPGSDEKNQLYRILTRISPPHVNQWPQFYSCCEKRGLILELCKAKLQNSPIITKSTSETAEHLIRSMLEFNPSKRISATQILNHPFLASLRSKSTSVSRKDQSIDAPADNKQRFQHLNEKKAKYRDIIVRAGAGQNINRQYYDNFILDKKSPLRSSERPFRRLYNLHSQSPKDRINSPLMRKSDHPHLQAKKSLQLRHSHQMFNSPYKAASPQSFRTRLHSGEIHFLRSDLSRKSKKKSIMELIRGSRCSSEQIKVESFSKKSSSKRNFQRKKSKDSDSQSSLYKAKIKQAKSTDSLPVKSPIAGLGGKEPQVQNIYFHNTINCNRFAFEYMGKKKVKSPEGYRKHRKVQYKRSFDYA